MRSPYQASTGCSGSGAKCVSSGEAACTGAVQARATTPRINRYMEFPGCRIEVAQGILPEPGNANEWHRSCCPARRWDYHVRMNERHDIVIIGGGLVGSSLAIALDGCGLRVALVEAARPQVSAQPSYDERNLALARASINALQALGVWAHTNDQATAIERIHVSRRGEFGAVRLDA